MGKWTSVADALLTLSEAVRALDDMAPAGRVHQAQSALGPRRHCAAVRRRLARGDSGAAKVGRDFWLTAEAYEEELSDVGTTKAEKPSIAAELTRDLRLVRGAR